MSDGGKGDKRRPGTMPDGAWEHVFGKRATDCEQCPPEALKYTGTARYSCPLQYELKCDICGMLHWVLMLNSSHLSEP